MFVFVFVLSFLSSTFYKLLGVENLLINMNLACVELNVFVVLIFLVDYLTTRQIGFVHA